MFNTHFGLTENPFHVIPNQKFYYPSLSHTQADNQLVENIRNREGLILLTGQTGTGKTLTIKRVISQLDASTTAILYQNQPDTRELMTFIQESLGLDENTRDQSINTRIDNIDKHEPQDDLNQLLQNIKTADINQLLNVVNQKVSLPNSRAQAAHTATQDPIGHYLHDQFRQGRNVVLFIDNVNNVEKSTIDTLLALSQTPEEPHNKRLQTVISCTPEIGTWLQRRYANKECRVSPLQNKEVAPYIDHLLRIAGFVQKFPFTSDATRKIAAHSQGMPGLINYLCRSALFTASFEQQQTITADMIDAAAGSYVNQTNDEVTFQPASAPSPEKPQRFNSNEFEYDAPQKTPVIIRTDVKQKQKQKQKPVILRTDIKSTQKPATLHTDLKNQTTEARKPSSQKIARKRVVESISTTNPQRKKSTASVSTKKHITRPEQHKVDTQPVSRPTAKIARKRVVESISTTHPMRTKSTTSVSTKKRIKRPEQHKVDAKPGNKTSTARKSETPQVSPYTPKTSTKKSAVPLTLNRTNPPKVAARTQHKTNTQSASRPAARTHKTEVKPKISQLAKVVRSTGNGHQTHEAWRQTVYDSLLLFITIGCVVTLYQFNSKGIDKLRTSGDAFASWDQLGQSDESASPLAKQVVLRIANLNPFNFNIMPALAAEFLKNEGATTVNTIHNEAGERTIVQGQFKNASGTTSSQIIELEPVSIHSKYKGMTTGRANIGISLADLPVDTLTSFQDKKQKSTPGQHTLALASAAVVTHPSNPISHLSTEQIASIFQGKMQNWKRLGGKLGTIQIHTLGGKHEYLQTVLTQSLGNIKITHTVQHDTPEQLAKAIAKDPNSLGLVSISDIGNMKALAISAQGQEPVQPSHSTPDKSGYPLVQAVHAYALNTQGNNHTNKFLKFIHSNAARTIFEKNGLAFTAEAMDTGKLQEQGITKEEFNDLTEQAQQLSSNIRFNSTMAILDDAAQRQIDRVTELLTQLNLQEDKLIILGYCYNSEFANTNKTISEERAEAVAKAFEDRGITPAVVNGLGSWNPDRKITRKEIEISGDQLPQIQIWTNL